VLFPCGNILPLSGEGNTGKPYRLSMIICTVFQNSQVGIDGRIEEVLFVRVIDRRIRRVHDYIGDPPPPPPVLGGPSGSVLSFKGSKGQPCKIISSPHCWIYVSCLFKTFLLRELV
jgi:hypothetical protein